MQHNYVANGQQEKYSQFRVILPSKSNTTRLGYGVSAEDEGRVLAHVLTAFFNCFRDFGLKDRAFFVVTVITATPTTTKLLKKNTTHYTANARHHKRRRKHITCSRRRFAWWESARKDCISPIAEINDFFRLHPCIQWH